MEETNKKIKNETTKLLNKLLEQGEQGIADNIEYVEKLVNIQKDICKIEEESDRMNYGNYGNYGEYNGRGPSRGSYGNYGNYGEYGHDGYGEYNRSSYGRRGVDSRYRGYGHLDRMYDDYGRYNESRERYGAGNEETDKSFHYMVKSLEDFIKVLHEEAETPQQKQMLNETLQRSMM